MSTLKLFGIRSLLGFGVVLSMVVSRPADLLGQRESAALAGQTVAKEIRPGDLVRLRVWREPELTGEFMVNSEGIVVLPRIGATDVSDETSESLKKRLVDTYSAFLQHSAVEVTVLRRIQVLGAVRTPGLYPIDPTMTVSDALALAGGITNQGDPSKIELVRRGRRLEFRMTEHTRMSESPIESGDQIYVPERAWVSRNPGIVAAALSATVSLLIALFR